MSDEGRYYEEELNYLVEAGREYARLHPERARYLNIRDPRARDPHVERLIEAFAFLTGKIRQRLDDDFPELTHALLDLVWPHYLRPVPPIAMLQFRPIPGMVREKQTVPRGFLVDSKPTTQEVSCRFSTCYPVDIYPIKLTEAGVITDPAGQRILRFRFALEEGAEPDKVVLGPLRVCITGEPTEAFTTYRVLRGELEALELRFGRDRRRLLSPARVGQVGFGLDEGILPYPNVSFPGYRLLSEYFVFPEKFLFVDFPAAGKLELEKGDKGFDLEVRFRQRPPDKFRPTTESFRLFSTPVINMFPRQGEPILVTQLKRAYRVLGDYTHPDAYDVVSVDSVEGLRRSDGLRRTHQPFYSFSHDLQDGDSLYYHPTSRFSATGSWVTYLSLISAVPQRLPGEETLSLELTCSNGRLCQEVGEGDIRIPGQQRLDYVTFANFTRPTAPRYPRLGEGAEWSFISHMALNFLSMAEASALREILKLYDVGSEPANQRRIESIKAVSARGRETLYRGAPVRGTELKVTIDETHFDDEGDLLLFIQVLAEFLSLYTGLNSFTELVVQRTPSGEVLRCPPAIGKQSLI
jgi:type VI secretion system protein ImpG